MFFFFGLFPDLDKEKRRRDVHVDRRRYRHHLLEPMFDDGTAGGGATLSSDVSMFSTTRNEKKRDGPASSYIRIPS